MTRLLKAVLATTGLAGACSVGTAVAHHAFAAEFDRDTPVQLTGSVTEMKWSNPHAWIYIDVEDENGNVVNWAFETRAANSIIRLGWRPKDLPVGTIRARYRPTRACPWVSSETRVPLAGAVAECC